MWDVAPLVLRLVAWKEINRRAFERKEMVLYFEEWPLVPFFGAPM